MKFLFLSFLFFSLSAIADMKMTWKTTGASSQQTCSPVIKMSKVGARIEFSQCAQGRGMGRGAFLILFDAKKSYMLDEEKKVAAEQQDAAEMRATLEKQAVKMNEMLAKMPADVRARLAKTNPHIEMGAAKTQYKELGRRKVGKWNCFIVLTDTGYSQIEHCLVPLKDAGFTADDMAAFKSFVDAQKKSQGGQSLYENELFVRYPDQAVVWTHNLKPQESTSELVSVDRAPLPKSDFSLDGFKIVKIADYMNLDKKAPGK